MKITSKIIIIVVPLFLLGLYGVAMSNTQQGGPTISLMDIQNKLPQASLAEFISINPPERMFNEILMTFEDFIETPSDANDSSIKKAAGQYTNSTTPYYSWSQFNAHNKTYPVLMLKFLDESQQIANNRIDYVAKIDEDISVNGSTVSGVDMKIIEENLPVENINNTAPSLNVTRS